MTLEDFLEQAMRTPFADGVQDCALMASDWAVACGWPDPARAYRGRYSTALGRERLLRREGGLVAVMAAGYGSAGLSETEEPKRGDVAVIELRGGLFAAILLGRRWAIKSTHGLMIEPAERVLKAWSIPHG